MAKDILKKSEGLVLWLSRLSCHLQCWHLIWLLVQVLAVPLSITLLANASGKAMEDGLIT